MNEMYPQNNHEFSDNLFKNPTTEYRGVPFWGWNCDLNRDQLMNQIENFKSMGFGGFHIHSRTGLVTPYLGKEFMELVKACVKKAKEEGMKVWLYDEDRWPSGTAGGLVTKDPKYRAKYLLFTPTPYEANPKIEANYIASAAAVRTGNGELLARYDIVLNLDGTLKSYHRMGETDVNKGTIWYAYLETPNSSPWFNNQTYLNTLDPASVKRFIEVTHEAYKVAVGSEFGGVIPAIFTDEPQFTHKTTLGFSHSLEDIFLPWTGDLAVTYNQVYGSDIIGNLPELIWELEENISITRYQYHDHIAERFAIAFVDTVGEWCKESGIKLTGHMMSEPTLKSQTAALGEAMRAYRGFEIPGVDMLRDHREYSTVKQAQSVAHQYGRVDVSSELYGVTNWDFDFRGHKLQGDWQAALGVTVRIPHHAWVSMAGEAKRDFPAPFDAHVPWYLEYPMIEGHFARVNTAMTRGKALVRIGVIHPIESYWLHFGPNSETAEIRQQMDENFKNLIDWLLFTHLDFDFISESLLPELCQEASAPIKVGDMTYDVILVPGCETLRRTTLERLTQFARSGGKLIFMGKPPKYIDASLDPSGELLVDQATNVPFEKNDLIHELRAYREIDLWDKNGQRAEKLLYQMRVDGEDRWLFICQGKKVENLDVAPGERIRIQIKGHWKPQYYNTLSGEINDIGAKYVGEYTIMECKVYAHDSMLFRLKPIRYPHLLEEPNMEILGSQVVQIPFKLPFELSEPNVYMLDMAEYAFDEGLYQPSEEILRIDNLFRKALGYPSRMDAIAQPWAVPFEKSEHILSLRFNILSTAEVAEPILAVEDSKNLNIRFNDVVVAPIAKGYYVDQAIHTIPLPKIKVGNNILELQIPFGLQTNTEWCYILGDFGVRIAGCEKIITKAVNKLAFGDITTQGLPFYGGNITYKAQIVSTGGEITLRVPHYRGELIGITLDGQRVGSIVFAPYTFTIKDVSPGSHEIGLILFGNRVNTFGAVHNANDSCTWFGPNAWRSEGDEWSYEYRLKKTGILKSPEIIQ